jgi:HK97 gp10 family phage protein
MGSFQYVGLAVLLGKARAAVTQAVTETADKLVTEAQGVAPVDTGALRASIHVESIAQSGFSVTATVSTGVDYSVFVEVGTSRMEGRKYMETSLLGISGQFREALTSAAGSEF